MPDVELELENGETRIIPYATLWEVAARAEEVGDLDRAAVEIGGRTVDAIKVLSEVLGLPADTLPYRRSYEAIRRAVGTAAPNVSTDRTPRYIEGTLDATPAEAQGLLPDESVGLQRVKGKWAAILSGKRVDEDVDLRALMSRHSREPTVYVRLARKRPAGEGS